MDLYQLDTMVANRQSQIYDRNNLIQTLANAEHSDFPVFDDDEYRKSWHSTG